MSMAKITREFQDDVQTYQEMTDRMRSLWHKRQQRITAYGRALKEGDPKIITQTGNDFTATDMKIRRLEQRIEYQVGRMALRAEIINIEVQPKKEGCCGRCG